MWERARVRKVWERVWVRGWDSLTTLQNLQGATWGTSCCVPQRPAASAGFATNHNEKAAWRLQAPTRIQNLPKKSDPIYGTLWISDAKKPFLAVWPSPRKNYIVLHRWSTGETSLHGQWTSAKTAGYQPSSPQQQQQGTNNYWRPVFLHCLSNSCKQRLLTRRLFWPPLTQI